MSSDSPEGTAASITYGLISIPSGNMIYVHTDRGDACEALLDILWRFPEERERVGLIEFDAEGMTTRRLWPEPEEEASL